MFSKCPYFTDCAKEAQTDEMVWSLVLPARDGDALEASLCSRVGWTGGRETEAQRVFLKSPRGSLPHTEQRQKEGYLAFSQ